jgi:hypothetical protein
LRLALFFALAAGVVISAQGVPPLPGTVPAKPPVTTGTAGIAGLIKDEQGGGLRRATVTLRGDGFTRSTVTDDAGAFAFVALPAGRFTVTASKAGYPPLSYGARRPNRPGSGVLLAAGQQVTGLSMTLARGGVLAGTVLDERGQPMPGVQVMAWEIRMSLAGERTLEYPATGGVSVASDDHGAYRLYGLPPGEYTVGTYWAFRGIETRVPSDTEIRAAFAAAAQPVSSNTATPAISSSEPRHFSYAPVFMPNTVDPMLAATVQLAAGQERHGLDLHMQFIPMSRIEGEVVDETGRAGGVSFQIARDSGVQALNVTNMYPALRDGTFRSDSLSPGKYLLLARGNSRDGRPMFAREELTISSGSPQTHQVTLRLQPTLTLTGRVVAQSREATPPPDLTGASVFVTPASGNRPGGTPTIADASGAFSVTGLIPERVRISAGLRGEAGRQWMLQSVTAGDQDITDVPFAIAVGQVPSITVTLTDQVSELSGTLTDAAEKPATDYFVIVASADRKYWVPMSRRIRSARPETSGRYIFRELPPGEYRIAVTTDLVQRDLDDVNALVQMMDQSAPLTVNVGEKKIFDIKLGER